MHEHKSKSVLDFIFCPYRRGDSRADLVTANGQISNANQTQTILNTMGKWVANPAATA